MARAPSMRAVARRLRVVVAAIPARFSGLVHQFAARSRRYDTRIGFPVRGDGRTVTLDATALGSVRRRRQIRRLRRAQSVAVTDAALGSQAGADALAVLGRCGVPLCVKEAKAEPGPRGGTALADVVRGAAPAVLSDDRRRLLQSVAVRRAAMYGTSRTTVSVVLATKRPHELESAVAMVASQRGVDVELLVGLHGAAWDDVAVPALAGSGLDIHVRRLDDDMTLGRVLADLTSMATGEFITKWDDDDLYGSHHLIDLIDAMSYAQAGLVGKAAEFVYLEREDLTVQRYGRGAESYSEELAGGTLMIGSATLRSVGGWPDVARHVDRELIASVRRHGHRIYRTHGFEYLLQRREAGGHTWDVDDRHFVDRAIATWPGRSLAAAGFDDRDASSIASLGA